jgi:hypothetical protein
MVEEKREQVTNAATELSSAFVDLLGQLWERDADSKEVYEAAIDLYSSVGQFIETLENLDDNLDPEKTNLPDVDYLFENHPVTDYINAVYNRAVNEDEESQQEVLKAAKELEKYQQEYDGLEDETEEDFEDGVSVYEYVYEVDDRHVEEIQTNLSIIEFALEGEEEFTEDDIGLMRYYFKHQPHSSHFDVEELSDRGIELAWKALQYKAGKL